MRRDLVVIGTSAGGIDALRFLVGHLPADFPAALAIVLHTAPDSPGILDTILARAGPLPTVTVKHVERLQPATIYVPAPDHHLVVEPSRLRATRGPRENRFRPAVDPLFRSAAQTYGPRVIGLILTGGLDDGTAGLWSVKQLGGLAVVQDPKDALAPSMPQSALDHVRVDHCVPLAEIPQLLCRLVREDIAEQGGYPVPKPLEIEVKIATEAQPVNAGVLSLGGPSRYACPECHGVLLEVKEGERKRFRCHTGHAYSRESLIAEIDEGIEMALWTSVRALQEKAIFMRDLAEHERGMANGAAATSYAGSAHDAERRAEIVRRATLEGTGDAAKDAA